MNISLIISAILPVIVFLSFIYRKDSEKEPKKLLAKCFLLGALSIIPVFLIELAVDSYSSSINSPLLHSLYRAFIVAALVEEGTKFFFLKKATWRNKAFNQSYDGIVYAVFVSLGFAMVENIMYVSEHGFVVSIFRGILSVPGHGLFGIMMGYFYALARFSNDYKRQIYLFLSFFVPFLFHGTFNFLLMYNAHVESELMMSLIFVAFIAFDIFMWKMGIKSIKRHYARDIRKKETINY